MKNVEKWIIVILTVIAVAAIGTAVYFGINANDNKLELKEEQTNNKSENEHNKLEENDDKELNQSEGRDYVHFVNMTDIGISYTKKLEQYNCNINDKGYLEGNCAIDELKNKKFINLMEGNDDFFGNVLALSEEGFVYNISCNEENKMFLKGKDKPLDDIEKMGYLKVYTVDCIWWLFPIYTIDNKDYILDLSSDDSENAEYILLSDAKTKNIPIATVWSCGYEGNEIFIDTTISINKNLVLSNGVIVKDKETKNNIEVKYSVYQFINGKESLHIISNDNKYYILNEESEFINKEGGVKNSYIKDNLLNLYLENGKLVRLNLIY